MTFTAIAKAAMQAKGIESGFVQQCVGLHHSKFTRVSGGGGQFEHRDEYYHTYRVVLTKPLPGDFDEKKAKECTVDVEKTDLLEAVREAFFKIGVALPVELAGKAATIDQK